MTAYLPALPVTCTHVPQCPPASATDHDAAKRVWHDEHLNASRLCNGIWIFADTGELVPDDGPCGCHIEAPHRGPVPHNNHKGQ